MNAATITFLISILAATTATDTNMAYSLFNCMNIDGSVARLNCYDALGKRVNKQLAAALPPALPEAHDPGKELSEQLNLEREKAKFNAMFHPSQEDLIDAFGAEQLHAAKRPPMPEQKLAQLVVDIVKVSMDARGKFFVELENGQLWHQKRDARIYFSDSELPLKSVIRRNSMGGYQLSLTKRNQNMFVERTR